ncbi:tetratricopeptide repeat protein 29 [Perognathus longimembris pacificus]|uniref:tetratricopeptide repeat protein 29 n=1 Tax=Perognathus longimembris pacificus TaxID=214514 RepID=UPI00201931E8|nr:tetratricopeptide repeat protein 29 [Perognathus longimembris pacificus]
MTTFPPLPVTRTRLSVLARQKLPCSKGRIPRSQLIKEKADIDCYLEANIKGLSKEEVAAYRNSYKKSICVDMLRDGYHKSFTELFGLMERWDSLRVAASLKSIFWLQKPLEERPDTLDRFYHYLTRAESAEREGYFEDVYNNLYALACYFSDPEDKWVRNHFYERCFNIAQLIKVDGGKKEAESESHMGLLYEEEGDLLQAAEHYEAFHHLTQGRIWKDEEGRFLSLLACESLLRIYRLLADKMVESQDYKQAIKTLTKASEIAREGNDRKMEGEASYYLGLARLSAGDYETALADLDKYSQISTEQEDDLSLGRAYEAIAKVLQCKGETTEAIKYLEKVVKISKNNFQSLDVVRASTMLGDIYNEKGKYSKASKFFQQAFDTTVELMNVPLTEETKVHYGIAKAHQMMLAMSNCIESDDGGGGAGLDCLLSWKENRSHLELDPAQGRASAEDLHRLPDPSPVPSAGAAKESPPMRSASRAERGQNSPVLVGKGGVTGGDGWPALPAALGCLALAREGCRVAANDWEVPGPRRSQVDSVDPFPQNDEKVEIK